MKFMAIQTLRGSASGRKRWKEGSVYILLLLLAMVFVGPFLWLVDIALKTPAELLALPVHWLPTLPAWSNFVQALTMVDFAHYALNSLFLSSTYAILVTFTSAMVGFGFARLKGRGKRQLFLIMLSTMMLPTIVTVIPTYIIFAHLGLINTYWPWVFWGLASSPFLAFLFRQFFSGLPQEMEEAAIIDGANYLQIFLRIFLPLSKPVIATAVIFSFTTVWGDYVSPHLFLDQDNTTLAVVVSSGYSDPHGSPFLTIQAAATIFYILPMIVLFFFAQRYFVRGIVTTGLKG